MLDQRGHREPVPGRYHLPVAARLRPLRPRLDELAPHVGPALAVAGVLGQLQHRRAVLKRALVGDPQQPRRPRPVMLPKHLVELLRRPHVGEALDPVGVRVQG